MQLVSKFNKGIRFLLCAIDVYSKCTWVVPSEDKKGVTNTNAFQKVLNESGHKGNKIWVDKNSEFYNRSVKSWLQDNNIEMHSTHNEATSVVGEKIIKTLKQKNSRIYYFNIKKCVYG